jgi:hypothetical protein
VTCGLGHVAFAALIAALSVAVLWGWALERALSGRDQA